MKGRLQSDAETKVRGILARFPEVAIDYLFGSRAHGRHSPLSNIDVAVLIHEGAGNDN